MKEKISISIGKLFVWIVGLVLFVACSSTRYVPEGRYLLNDVTVRVDQRAINKDELKGQVRQKGNLKILGFLKFHLGLYNLSSKKKDDGWLKRIGEAPVLYQEYQTERAKEQLLIFLRNRGFYDAVVKDTAIFHAKKPKVDLIFRVEAGTPYRIRRYQYQIEDENLNSLILGDTARQVIGATDIFDVDRLDAERDRLSTLLRNHGYYGFSTDYISYLADSSLNRKLVDLTVVVADANMDEVSDTIIPHKRFVVRNYRVNPDYVPPQLLKTTSRATPDTIFSYNFV